MTAMSFLVNLIFSSVMMDRQHWKIRQEGSSAFNNGVRDLFLGFTNEKFGFFYLNVLEVDADIQHR